MTERSYKWLLLALLWVVALLNYLDRQLIFSLFPPLEAEFGLSSVQLGFLGTAFLWVYGLLSPVGGYVADRFGRRRVILSSLAVWSAVTYLTGHVRNYNELLAARALMGTSEAFYLPAALALIADYHGEETRSRATGLHQSGLYAGIVLGGIGGGWMGDRYGWRTAFLILGVTGVLYAAALVFGLKDTPGAQRGRRAVGAGLGFGWSMRALMSARPFALLLTANSLASMAYWVVYTWLPLFLYERFQMSLTLAGFSATFYIQAASFAGILAGGWLADHWSRSNPRGRLLTQFLGFATAGPFLFMVGAAGSLWILLPGLILFGLGRGFFDCNLMPVLCQIVSPKLRATGYGILNFASCIAGGVMAAAAGAVKNAIGLGGALEISAVMLLIAAVLLLRVRVETACAVELQRE